MIEKVLDYLNTGRGEEMTEEIVRMMSELTGEELDESFRLFPPFILSRKVPDEEKLTIHI